MVNEEILERVFRRLYKLEEKVDLLWKESYANPDNDPFQMPDKEKSVLRKLVRKPIEHPKSFTDAMYNKVVEDSE
jgi:hypothetical protein